MHANVFAISGFAPVSTLMLSQSAVIGGAAGIDTLRMKFALTQQGAVWWYYSIRNLRCKCLSCPGMRSRTEGLLLMCYILAILVSREGARLNCLLYNKRPRTQLMCTKVSDELRGADLLEAQSCGATHR